jgi:hypothetical protein
MINITDKLDRQHDSKYWNELDYKLAMQLNDQLRTELIRKFGGQLNIQLTDQLNWLLRRQLANLLYDD